MFAGRSANLHAAHLFLHVACALWARMQQHDCEIGPRMQGIRTATLLDSLRRWWGAGCGHALGFDVRGGLRPAALLCSAQPRRRRLLVLRRLPLLLVGAAVRLLLFLLPLLLWEALQAAG